MKPERFIVKLTQVARFYWAIELDSEKGEHERRSYCLTYWLAKKRANHLVKKWNRRADWVANAEVVRGDD